MSVRDVRVRYAGGDRLDIAIGDHSLVVDQPHPDGGRDAGPTPTELFIASLVSCMGFFAQRFLRRNGVDADGLELEAKATFADRPSRIGSIDLVVRLPPIDESLVAPLRRVIEHCTVHNTLTHPPVLRIELDVTGRKEVA